MTVYDYEIAESALAACRERVAQGNFTLDDMTAFAKAQGVPPWVPANMDRLYSVTRRLVERLIAEARKEGRIVFKDGAWKKR